MTVSWTDRPDADNPIAGDRLLREALGEIDEPTFNNLFAIGLGEIQHLATLSGTQAAQSLYRLTSGLDRVSLYDVIQGLRQTRGQLIHEITAPTAGMVEEPSGRLFSTHLAGGPARPTAFPHRRAEGTESPVVAVGGSARKSSSARSRWSKPGWTSSQHAARTIEIAVGLKSNWRRRAKLTHLIHQLGGGIPLPEDAIDRLETLQEKMASHQREADILQGQRHQLRDEDQRLGVNELLVQNAWSNRRPGRTTGLAPGLGATNRAARGGGREFQQRLTSEQTRLSSSLGLSSKSAALREVTQQDLKKFAPANRGPADGPATGGSGPRKINCPQPE